MRSAEWARPVERATRRQVAEQAPDLRDLEGLGELERRHYSRDTAGGHRFAGAGRTAQQQVVASGGRDLDRPARVLLAVAFGGVVLDTPRRTFVRDFGEELGRDLRLAQQLC